MQMILKSEMVVDRLQWAACRGTGGDFLHRCLKNDFSLFLCSPCVKSTHTKPALLRVCSNGQFCWSFSVVPRLSVTRGVGGVRVEGVGGSSGADKMCDKEQTAWADHHPRQVIRSLPKSLVTPSKQSRQLQNQSQHLQNHL